ncbi:hypothetical protein DTO164E3_170 [Paecilomyces variotii]|nr:hypothetical protein DTO164E3_170 [Paecilomyces variotii]KAJ9260391.1 hypothetical protein DTO207G8_436 [Paecilomyces variotii]KAJ9348975.1 hypothetical protein DTO027B9_7878 [Paecilomyces variotii]
MPFPHRFLHHPFGFLPRRQPSEEHNHQNAYPDFPNPNINQGQERFYARYQAHVRREPESPSPEPRSPATDLAAFRYPESLAPFESPESGPVNLSPEDRLLALVTGPERARDSEIAGPHPFPERPDNMIGPNPQGVPYTISSEEWSLASNSSKDSQGVGDISEGQLSARLKSVVSVYSTVYAVAKTAFTIFENYGVELDDTPAGIKFHIERAEAAVTSNSIPTLIKTIEDCYYVLYARLAIEMGNVQLCASFNLDIRRLSGRDTMTLPEPSHLYLILRACKEVLEAPEVCKVLDAEIVKQHQEEFVRRAMAEFEQKEHTANDLLGYRRYITSLIEQEDSEFSRTWRGLNPVYQMAPGEILAMLSEKYLSVEPVKKNSTLATRDLPFIDRERVNPDAWEREIILDNRQATWAKLEGKSVGEMRREDERRPLLDYVKECKCICFSFCSCATECTNNVERLCPCAERMMRILLAEGSSPRDQAFGQRCADLAALVFEGLASVYRGAHGSEMAMELKSALDLFKREVLNERLAALGARE